MNILPRNAKDRDQFYTALFGAAVAILGTPLMLLFIDATGRTVGM